MTKELRPADDGYAERVRESVLRQQALATIGTRLEEVTPGAVTLAFEYQQHLTQQHGFIHAGILATVLDSACGYAAYSLMPADAGVLTIEFKINLLSPARGERFVAHGRVAKPGRTITVAQGDLYGAGPDGEKHVASMTATIMTIAGRDDVRG